MRFAICNELFEGWTFPDVCRFVREAGYDGLELAPFTLATPITDLTAPRRREIRDQAADAGVQIVGLHWLLAKTSGLHLTSPDRATRDRTADYLVALAEACRDLGGRVMVFGSPAQRSLQPGVTRDQGFAWAVETFRDALVRMAETGVTICLEPLASEETNFLTTCAEAVELVDAIGHNNCVLHLDVKAMSSEPTPVPDLIGRYAGRAGHFHANDANRKGPGFGETDFVPIFHALTGAGYDGWVSVEVFDFKPDPETIAKQSLDYMNACLHKKESVA